MKPDGAISHQPELTLIGLHAGRHCPGLSVACQGGTGDPRLRNPHKANRFAGTP